MATLLPPPAPTSCPTFPPCPPATTDAERAAPGGGRLVAAGVLAIVGAVPPLLFGLYLLTLAHRGVGSLIDDASGGALSFMGGVVALVAAVVITFGAGACGRRNWGRIGVLVTHGLFGAGWCASGVIGLFSPDRSSSIGTMIVLLVVMVAWFATVLFLAATGRPRRAR